NCVQNKGSQDLWPGGRNIPCGKYFIAQPAKPILEIRCLVDQWDISTSDKTWTAGGFRLYQNDTLNRYREVRRHTFYSGIVPSMFVGNGFPIAVAAFLP